MTRRRNGCEAGWRIGLCGELERRPMWWCGPGRASSGAHGLPRRCPLLLRGRGCCCMAFDPELVAETRAWFAKAFNDLCAAEALMSTSPPLLDEAVFHCQPLIA